MKLSEERQKLFERVLRDYKRASLMVQEGKVSLEEAPFPPELDNLEFRREFRDWGAARRRVKLQLYDQEKARKARQNQAERARYKSSESHKEAVAA